MTNRRSPTAASDSEIIPTAASDSEVPRHTVLSLEHSLSISAVGYLHSSGSLLADGCVKGCTVCTHAVARVELYGQRQALNRPLFQHATNSMVAEGCRRAGQIALSPAFRALDTHDLRRGLRAHGTNRTRTRHARSPQRVACTWDKSHSRLHFAHSTRAISAEGCAHSLHFAHSTRVISAEGCARPGQIALSPAFSTLDTHDLRRGLRAHGTNRTLACISHTRHARSPQRVARTWDKSHSCLLFAHSTRTISAEGCAGTGQIALSPAFRALDAHDLRRGLHFRLTPFVPRWILLGFGGVTPTGFAACAYIFRA